MTFLIPSPPEHCRWQLGVDTAADLPPSGAEPIVAAGSSRTLESRSSVVLVASPSTPAVAKPLADPTVETNRGCNPLIEDCARAMGGNDPASTYAAAMLWYQGYPEAPLDTRTFRGCRRSRALSRLLPKLLF